MKNFVLIALLFSFLLLPTSEAIACGSAMKEKSCCAKADDSKIVKSCCDNKEATDSGCDGSCDHDDCHCPVGAQSAVMFNAVAFVLQTEFFQISTNTDMAIQSCKSGYISIWQPPKIS